VTEDQPHLPLFGVQRTNTILYCAQWAATVAFYRDWLGLPITHATDWFVEFQVGEEAFLSIADSARATIRAVKGEGITLSWQVADIAAIQQRLNDLGIVTTPLKQKWGAQLLYFHDPEGHRLELWEAL
jgi:catechol 2,3-dioxygenase-like lactoylglutathione lyase family enzyme